MKIKQLLTKSLLVAVCLLVGASNAWGAITVPDPVFTENFENASFSGTAFTDGTVSGTLTGTGSIGSDDATFGKYYQNMTTSADATTSKANYLTISTSAFSTVKTAGNKAITVSFWINPFYAVNLATGNNQYGNIFVAYGSGTTVNTDLAIGLNARANLGTHCNLNYAPYSYYYDESTGDDYSWLSKGTDFASSWHHVALVYSLDASNNVVYKQYVDGTLKNSFTKGNSGTGDVTTYNEMTVLDQFTRFVIGGDDEIFGDPDNAFAYDEINIYSSALTPAQVRKIYADKQGINIVYAQDFSEDEDGGTSSDVTKYGMTAGSNGGTYTTTITDGKYTSVAGKTGSDNASGYTEHYISFDALAAGKLVTVSYDWLSGSATGKSGSSRSETMLKDASGNVILKLSLYGQDYQWKVNDTNFGTSGKSNLTPSSGSAHTVVATINMSSKKIVSLSIDGNSYATNLDFYNSEATSLSRLYISQTTGSTLSWANTATLDNIVISTQDIISATVNAKNGETVLGTEIFTALSGETIHYGWPKYILKDGVLYNNQQRTAGAQYTGSTTTTTEVNNNYSVVNLGTATAEYFNELGSGVTYASSSSDGNYATWMRASHGNVTSASGKSTEGSCVLTVAAAGVLPAGTYTFELGNYKNRASIVKVGDIKVGTTAKGTNGATYVVTTLENVIVPEGAAVTIINASGTSATENIDYFLAIRTGDASVSKTITSAGWATFCSPYALDLANAEGLTDAYIVTGGENGVLTKNSVMNGTVPANTGLLLKGAAGTSTIPVVASSETNVSANKLEGVTANTDIAAEAGYVLMNDETNGLGFYKNSNAFTVGANTAYLPASFDDGGARASYLLFDDMTGISQVAGSEVKTNGVIYNLNGQRVSNPTKGIYIIDGLKVAIE